ncbi:endosialidase [[Clostridium] colinum]|uniref:endosialidase n=1 Tax=[Clostridium] colinum TaxID=36835 RepID=UPI00202561DB|nr:endosialidase [[Clostridium] colinum]
MSAIQQGIILNEDKTLSFGNYEVSEKIKVKDFNVDGNIYKIRTHNEVTRLSKNGNLLLETVPGATIHNLFISEKESSFLAEGLGDTLITLELEPNTTYSLFINDVNIDKIKTNLSGKINFSTTLSKETQQIKIEKNI